MSRPNFSVSKACATTSTTNATTSSNFAHRGNRAVGDSESNNSLARGLLPPSLTSDSSPKFGTGSIAPAKVSLSIPITTNVTDNTESSDRHDLLGIFERYDVSAVETDLDLLEEKMKLFKVPEHDTEKDSSINANDTNESFSFGYVIEKDSTDSSIQVETPQGELERKNEQNLQATLEQELKPASEPELEPELALPSELEPISNERKDIQLQKNAEELPEPLSEKNETSPIVKSVDYQDPKPEDLRPATQPSISMQPYDPTFLNQDEIRHELETSLSQTESIVSGSTRPRTKRQGSLSRASSHVDPRQQHQLSHKPFDFNTFLHHLKSKSAEPIIKYTKSFLAAFTRQANSMSLEQMTKAISDFKAFIDMRFGEYEPFASMDDTDLENSREGIEKLIMNCLYDVCFSPSAFKKFGSNTSAFVHDDLEEDQRFSLQIEKYSWVLGIHLDVDLGELSSLKKSNGKDHIDYMEHARQQLNKINEYRAPRDKIICVLNACKMIFSLLKVTKNETNADSFIPLLILVILKAKTPNFISNISYILRFRGRKWLDHGETSYYLSTIEAAVTFIQEIKMDDLTIDESHYNAHMEAWEANLRQSSEMIVLPQPQHIGDSESRAPQSMSPSTVLLASAGMIGKSLTNFLSLSPLTESTAHDIQDTRSTQDVGSASQSTENQVDETFEQLSEVFPDLDKGILRDVIIMNDGDIERSLEACLQLVSE